MQRHYIQDPSPLPDLTWKGDHDHAKCNLHVRCKVIRDNKKYIFSESNLKELHWTLQQRLKHLVSAGAGLQTGDVFGTGTISSDRTNEETEKTGLNCIWDRQLEGARLSSLPNSIHETLPVDNDETVMTARVEGDDGKMPFGFDGCKTRCCLRLRCREYER